MIRTPSASGFFYFLTILDERVQQIVLRDELLLGDRRVLHVDRFGVVVEGWGLAKNGERAHDRGDREDPEEQPIQNHRHETPVLILLWNKDESKISSTFGFLDAPFLISILLTKIRVQYTRTEQEIV